MIVHNQGDLARHALGDVQEGRPFQAAGSDVNLNVAIGHILAADLRIAYMPLALVLVQPNIRSQWISIATSKIVRPITDALVLFSD